MPTISCEFTFHRNPAIYYSGEQVSGNVALTTTKDLKVEALRINFKGVANVSWYARSRQSPIIEHNDGANENKKLQYQGHEVYVDETRPLLEHTIIYAGRHEYKFTFDLPANCPATSGRHEFGEAFYCVSLVLKRCTKFDKKFEQRFMVKNRLDLNADAKTYMSQAVHSHYLKNIDAEVQFSTPRTGYVPGQNIKFRLDVATTAAEILRHLRCKVRLCQKNYYRCQKPRVESKEIIWKLANTKFSYGDHRKKTNSFDSSLHLSLLTPITSQQNPSTIISISYYLEALLFTKNKLLLAKLCIPITVGSKALKNICDSPRELQRFCYDNFKVEDIYKISSEFNKKAEHNKLPPTVDFVKNLNNDHSLVHNKFDHNKNVYLTQRSSNFHHQWNSFSILNLRRTPLMLKPL